MRTASYLVKHTLIKQTRSYSFALLLVISIFLAFLCVPAANAGYEIFYLGGVRGIYNSYWLGAIATMLPVILLWLPCFYLLRSQVSEDKRLNIGQVIAAAPVRKSHYIFGKFIANFFVLLAAHTVFTFAMMIMQLIHHESFSLNISAYLLPMMVITIPYLLFLAALTLIFDTAPGLKGAFGNVMIFVLWITLTTISVATPGSRFDLFGVGYVLKQMMQGALDVFPNLPEGGSFGYYPQNSSIPTFEWQGMQIDTAFMINRILWLVIILGLVILSTILFDRFKLKNQKAKMATRNTPTAVPRKRSLKLTQIKKRSTVNPLLLIKGELKLLLSGQKTWWYILSGIAIVLSSMVVVGEGLKWASLILLLPIGLLSQLGCREKAYNMDQLMTVTGPWLMKWIASFIAGLMITTLFSSGLLVRFILENEWTHVISWCIGGIFLTSLALFLGTLLGNRKAFEGLTIALFYFGPINNMGKLDFFGIQQSNAQLFIIVSLTLLLGSFVVNNLKKGVH